MDREISHAKFRVLREFLAHQRYTLWTLAGGTTQKQRGPREIYHHEIWFGAKPPPHPSALKSALESANPRMDLECACGCPWSTARATAPSPGLPTPGVVKQDKSSGGSVDTTKTRSDP